MEEQTLLNAVNFSLLKGFDHTSQQVTKNYMATKGESPGKSNVMSGQFEVMLKPIPSGCFVYPI